MTTEPDLCVRQVPIFNHLSLPHLEQIEGLVHHTHFAKNSTLYMADSPADALYIIHAGQVKIVHGSANGREQVLRILQAGDFDGDRALFADALHAGTAEAVTPVTACVLRKQDFQQLLAEYPAISLAVMRELAKRVDQLEAQTTLTATASVGARVAHFISSQADEHGDRFKLPMKKKDLADFLGTTPETLSRKLTDLAAQGVISQPNVHEIVVHDRSALANFS